MRCTFVSGNISKSSPNATLAITGATHSALTYSAAGHNPPRLVRGDRVIALDGCGALPLGIEDGEDYRQATVRLARGDLLLLYTDGVTEAPRRRDRLVVTSLSVTAGGPS